MQYKDPITGYTFEVKSSDVDMKIQTVTLFAAWEVGMVLNYYAGKAPVVTSASRSEKEQRRAMDRLKKPPYNLAYYNQVYGKLLASGTKVADFPHVRRGALDYRLKGFEKAIPAIQLLVDKYRGGITKVLGYVPSDLVVIEAKNCFHVQTPRGITEDSQELRGNLLQFIRDIVQETLAAPGLIT